MKRLAAALLLFLLPLTALFAGSRAPFQDQRVVSPEGTHYLVVRKADRGVRFELCLRREDAPPIAPARISRGRGERERPAPRIDRDPLDAVVAKGFLDRIPDEFEVLDSEPAAILFRGRRPDVESSIVIRLLGPDGEIRWRHALTDIYPDAMKVYGLTRRMGIPWYRDRWTDEARGKILLIAMDDRLREIDIETGAVSTPLPPVLYTRFVEGPERERLLALEIAARLRPRGLAARAVPLAADELQPLSIRIRAAACALRAGEAKPFRALWTVAVNPGQPPEVRRVAVAHLPELLGIDAIPTLRTVWSEQSSSYAMRTAVMEGFAVLARLDVESVFALARDEKQDRYFRQMILLALGDSGVAADDLGARLSELLKKGGTIDSDIILALTRLKYTEGAAAIIVAWERMDRDDSQYRYVASHLKLLTGKDFGLDPMAWRRGLGLK